MLTLNLLPKLIGSFSILSSPFTSGLLFSFSNISSNIRSNSFGISSESIDSTLVAIGPIINYRKAHFNQRRQ